MRPERGGGWLELLPCNLSSADTEECVKPGARRCQVWVVAVPGMGQQRQVYVCEVEVQGNTQPEVVDEQLVPQPMAEGSIDKKIPPRRLRRGEHTSEHLPYRI